LVSSNSSSGNILNQGAMDNLEKLATQVTQNEEKQSKNSTQYV
jgi:hypothetical protein